MKKASFVVLPAYRNNKIFDLDDRILNRDNCLMPYFLLREAFKKNGVDLSTQDINEINVSDIVIYNEMPKNFSDDHDTEKSFLMIFESELIRPDNWDLEKHKKFKKIFTWNDKFVDNKTYFKFNFPNNIVKTEVGVEGRGKLATLIAGNKSSKHPLELYSKRLDVINWFEKNHQEDFDYYGFGWNRFDLGNGFFGRVIKKLKIQERFFQERKTPCYRGLADEKLEVYRRYKFAICYENARDISGYITEKIFDCLFAGCVPVYWGASNIADYVDKGCFIDRRDFGSNENLYLYLKQIDDETYIKYQKNILAYLSGEKVNKFSSEHFVNTLIRQIISPDRTGTESTIERERIDG